MSVPPRSLLRPRRSALYMPGANVRALAKARVLPADVVILDLEDSVAPAAKDAARAQVADAVRDGGFGPREVVIRVNGAGTEWAEADLTMLAEARPDAVLLPKVSDPATVTAAAERTGLPVWAMIETPAALLRLDRVAAAPGLACLVLGLNDLAKDTRTRFVPGRAPMLPWLAIAILAARAHGLDILDGVFNRLDDPDGLRAECRQGRDLGFDGKTAIHPAQLTDANAAFSPEPAEVEEARRIVALFEGRPEQGVAVLDGRMVEALHAGAARRVMALAEAIASRQVAAETNKAKGSLEEAPFGR